MPGVVVVDGRATPGIASGWGPSPRPDRYRLPVTEPRRPERALKRALFAVTVVGEVDLVPTDDGVVLPGSPVVLASWEHCRAALGSLPATHAVAPEVLTRWLRLTRLVADTPELVLADGARVVGLPRGHALHPGPDWVVERVHGEALDLGVGIRGLDATDGERVVLVPPSAWAAAGLDPHRWWRAAVDRLEEMGGLAIARMRRSPDPVLRPMGDADVVTLLGSRVFRAAVAGEEGGMAAVAVPMRRRGWLRLSLLDPAFAPAAALASEPVDRGFARAVLVTAEEVALAGDGPWALAAALDGRLPAGDTAPSARR